MTVLHEWAAGTCLENLAGGPDGSWWVTSPTHHRVDRIGADGALADRVGFRCQPTGIVADPDDPAAALVAVGEPGEWRLVRVRDGRAEAVAGLDGVAFANGLTWHRGELLVADSTAGALAVVDPAAGRTRIVRTDPLLTPPAPDGLPGVNGLASAADGTLLLTSTARRLLLQLAGDPGTGPLTVVAEDLLADDLTAGPDGAVYLATHTDHTILRLAPDGTRTVLAGLAEGVAGPTSVTVEPGGAALVTCTTGGLLAPPPGGVQPARLIRLPLTGPDGAS